jgi:hypothetical protein
MVKKTDTEYLREAVDLTKRERIARAMGWTKRNPAVGNRIWLAPGKYKWAHANLPDPENSDTDCHALIDWLVERGWSVNIDFTEIGKCSVLVHVPYKTDAVPLSCENYRQGVVELADKVIRDE